jgi:type II secretory pathway pseudopilin PulG
LSFWAARRGRSAAFTLVELLTVIAVIVLIAGLAVPAISSLQGTQSLAGTAYAIGGIFDQARSYAMANNTYAFVGIGEFDDSQPANAVQVLGTGRVVVVAVASANGTSIYDPNNPETAWNPPANSLVGITPPHIFENIHITEDTSAPPAAPNTLNRPPVTSAFNVGDTSFTTSTPFSFPLTGTPRYTFTKVISFDPQGTARVINGTVADAIPSYLELDLQQSRKNQAPGSPTDNPINYAALQCDGMTGTTRVYR